MTIHDSSDLPIRAEKMQGSLSGVTMKENGDIK